MYGSVPPEYNCKPEIATRASGKISIHRAAEGDEPLDEAVICESISGGADYENEMPRRLTLSTPKNMITTPKVKQTPSSGSSVQRLVIILRF